MQNARRAPALLHAAAAPANRYECHIKSMTNDARKLCPAWYTLIIMLPPRPRMGRPPRRELPGGDRAFY